MMAPVLLVGFNRPEKMGEVFASVRKARPDKLYIAVDGPRESVPDDFEKCQECRAFADKVDWPCEIHTLFREANIGCGPGVSEAITWAFETTDRLIILEDDCVPARSFFTFCDEMLEKYKDDSRVWQVCGRSYHPDSRFFDESDYLFSHFAHIWGWATWKRCWDCFDLMMSDFPAFLRTGGALNVYQSRMIGRHYNRLFSKLYRNLDSVSSHTWDYQWCYTIMKNGGLGIVPKKNLIRNIGSDYGTHAFGLYVDKLPVEEMPEIIRHPMAVMADEDYDAYHYRHHIRGPFLIRVRNKISLIIKKFLSR